MSNRGRQEGPPVTQTTISRAALGQALADLTGIDPHIIRSVHVTPDRIIVEYYAVGEDGARVQPRIEIEVTP